MTFTFRPAVRENVGLLIGLIGPSGGGKTFSAMRLAAGLAGDRPFCVIDTEARRALHYADEFTFDHGELGPPFRPDRYADAIMAADKAGYSVIVVDSCSHAHAGEGGVLDWQEEELTRMAGDDWKKREACKMASWIKPKMSQKAMVQRLLQVRAHLILCFRAEPKIEMVKGEGGRLEVRPKASPVGLDGWIPICDKSMPYELTASFLLTPDRPGVPQPIKLQEQHRQFFPQTGPIAEKAGESLAAWALGSSKKQSPSEPKDAPTILAAIEKARGEWKRQPPPAIWRAICQDIAGAEDLTSLDITALSDALRIVKAYSNGDPKTISRINAVALKAKAEAESKTGGAQ